MKIFRRSSLLNLVKNVIDRSRLYNSNFLWKFGLLLTFCFIIIMSYICTVSEPFFFIVCLIYQTSILILTVLMVILLILIVVISFYNWIKDDLKKIKSNVKSILHHLNLCNLSILRVSHPNFCIISILTLGRLLNLCFGLYNIHMDIYLDFYDNFADYMLHVTSNPMDLSNILTEQDISPLHWPKYG